MGHELCSHMDHTMGNIMEVNHTSSVFLKFAFHKRLEALIHGTFLDFRRHLFTMSCHSVQLFCHSQHLRFIGDFICG